MVYKDHKLDKTINKQKATREKNSTEKTAAIVYKYLRIGNGLPYG